MRVKFIKDHTINTSTFREGVECNLKPKMVEKLFKKGLVEILEDHTFNPPKPKKDKKIETNIKL